MEIISVSKLIEKLIKFKTTNDSPREIMECFGFISDYLKAGGLGLKTYSSGGFPCLVASRRLKKHYQYILNGHFDVVPATATGFKPRIKGGRLYGRGASDMKGVTAAMIELIKDPDLEKTDIALMLTSDEEIGGFNGVKYLLEKEKYSCDCAIIPDGGENFSLIVGEKGVLHLKFEAKGEAAHGAEPWLGDNALEKLLRIYQNLKNSFPKITPPDYWQPTVNLGILKGGDATNKVPDWAVMQLDFRFPDIDDEVKIINLVKKEVKKESGVKWEILVKGCPLVNDLNNKYLKRIQAVAKKEKIRLKIKREHGASDGRFFSQRGIPVVMFKPICSEAHIKNEWIDLKSLEKFYHLLKSFLLKTD